MLKLAKIAQVDPTSEEQGAASRWDFLCERGAHKDIHTANKPSYNPESGSTLNKAH